MFETAELGRKLSKSQYEELVRPLRTDLLRVQNELRRSKGFSVIVVVAGVDGAGKGDTVNVLHQWMDPRYLETHAFGPLTDEERERPPTWRFWRVLPPKGKIGYLLRVVVHQPHSAASSTARPPTTSCRPPWST